MELRIFLYLDQEKIISLYSQLFDGFIESIEDRKTESSIDQEKQKGQVGSGREMLISDENLKTKIERKILNDHVFTLVENRLKEKNRLLEITNEQVITKEEISNVLTPLQFIKVKGEATFFDSEALISLLDNFNDLGEAMAFLETFSPELGTSTLNFDGKKPYNSSGKKNNFNEKIKNYAKEKNYHLDNQFLISLKKMISEAYKNSLELSINIGDFNYTAALNRSCLRDDENLLIGRLARKTEAQITLFGIVTQIQNSSNDFNFEFDFENGLPLRSILKTLVSPVTELEKVFSGKTNNEIIILPLAIYIELK